METLPGGTMREYETVYVLKPEVEDKNAKNFMLKMKELVQNAKGKNIKVDCLGRRRLAWPRLKHQRGVYVHHTYLGPSGLVKEYERSLGLAEDVILRQTILLNQEVDPAGREEQEDQLDIPIVRERREMPRGRYSNFFDDQGDAPMYGNRQRFNSEGSRERMGRQDATDSRPKD